jgi:hypothetical protein
MNIYEKMSAVTSELQTVAKNLTVQQTKNSSYKAVSERDILDAVKPLEAKYGIYSYPISREILESNLLESESTYNGQTTKKTTFMTRIMTVYRFVNIEKPEEYIETTTFAEGIDSQDKGSGKAMTYGDKYALMKAYKISTGDDPDQTASEETNYSKKTNNSTKKATPAKGTAKTPRERLIARINELHIDINAYAKQKGLSSKTTDETYLSLLEELAGVEAVETGV